MQNLEGEKGKWVATSKQKPPLSQPFVGGEHLPTSFACHDAHHFLKTLVTFGWSGLEKFDETGVESLTSNSANNQDFFTADVCHCSLSNLYKHSKYIFLKREAQIRGGDDVKIL